MATFSEIRQGASNALELSAEASRHNKNDKRQGIVFQTVGSMQTYQVLFSTVSRQQFSTFKNIDPGTMGLDILISQGDTVSKLGKQFLDLLVRTGEAARQEADSARDDRDFVERQIVSRDILARKVLAQTVSAKDNFRQQQITDSLVRKLQLHSRPMRAPV